MKLSIVGTGHVGAAVGFAALLRGACTELTLVNRNRERALGEAMDLSHAAALLPDTVRVRAGEVGEVAGSGVVVLTLSVPWDPRKHAGRDDLAAANVPLFEEWVPRIAAAAPDAVLLIVTNPVDAMTGHALRLSGFDPARVIGTGTLIDSARYRSLLSEEIGVHPDDIRAYILGEHGDTQFALHSAAATGGARFYESDLTRRLFDRTVRSGTEVTGLKGHTNWAVALAAVEVVRAVAEDSRRTLPVSTLLDAAAVRDWPGLADELSRRPWPGPVCLSLPTVVGRGGAVRTLRPELSPAEAAALLTSAEAVHAAGRLGRDELQS